MPVVAQVEELVVPLSGDSQGIFEEGDDDQESTNGGDISALHQLSVLSFRSPCSFVSSLPPSSQPGVTGEGEPTA